MKLALLVLFCGVCSGHRAVSSNFRHAGHADASTFTAAGTGESPDVSDDYNEQTRIRVPAAVRPDGARRHLPFTVEALIAGIWCLMMASIPLVLSKYTEHEMTRLVVIEGVGMLIWLVVGIGAFTQVILFQSAHFDGHRSLTMVESTYLLTQILTTIGYGDITPAYARGQVVMGFYIVLSVLLIGNMFSQVVEVVQEKLAKAREEENADFSLDEDDAAVNARLQKSETRLMEEAKHMEEPKGFDWKEPHGNDYMPCLKAFVVYACIAIVGILFFHLYPGEDKSLLEATYMSLVTLSTVGFGAFTATTEVGKAFASFWMLVGVAALGNFVNTCIEWSLKQKVADAHCHVKEHQEWTELVRKMDVNKDGYATDGEFMRFALVHAGYCTEEQVEKVQQFFRRMHPDAQGRVPIEKFHMLGKPSPAPTPR